MDTIPITLIGSSMMVRVHSPAYRKPPIFFSRGLPRSRQDSVPTDRPETAQAAAEPAPHKSVILDTLHLGKYFHGEKPRALDRAEGRALKSQIRVKLE